MVEYIKMIDNLLVVLWAGGMALNVYEVAKIHSVLFGGQYRLEFQIPQRNESSALFFKHPQHNYRCTQLNEESIPVQAHILSRNYQHKNEFLPNVLV